MGLFGSKKDRMQEALAKNLKKQILGAKSVAKEYGGMVESYSFDDTQYDFYMSLEGERHGVSVFKNSELIWFFNAGYSNGYPVDKTAYEIFGHLLNICRQEWEKSNAKANSQVMTKTDKAGKIYKESELTLLQNALHKTK